MPEWVWIAIATLVVIAALILVTALRVGRRKRTEGLQQRFGPEYDRTVSAAGVQGSAEKQLVERERRRESLDIVALTPEAQREFSTRWRDVQAAFVDDPRGALGDADQLINEVMRERGYPVRDFDRDDFDHDDFDQRAQDISVDHPGVVQNYRAAHDIQQSAPQGEEATEDQRQAFVHYRSLFEKLLDTEPQAHQGTPRTTESTQEASA